MKAYCPRPGYPGRPALAVLLDLGRSARRRSVKGRILVLDEADRMLDMGAFVHDVKKSSQVAQPAS